RDSGVKGGTDFGIRNSKIGNEAATIQTRAGESTNMKINSHNHRPFHFATLALAGAALFSFAAVGQAQNLTQSGFTGVLVPQYMGSGSSTRLPVMFRATVSGLTASTTYRYYVQAALSSAIGTTASGAGNPIFAISGGYVYTTGPGLSTAGTYDSFTTDANGSYTGWFGFVYTSNAAFTAGNTVYPTITLNAGGTGTSVSKRLALDVGILVQSFATTAGANNCSFIQSTSSATAKNLALLYDNVSGTGRPLAIAPVEAIGTTIASVITGYSTSSGAWSTSIPNSNANGVRRIEQRSLAANAIVGYSTDADGSWPTGSINTVNPVTGTTAIVIAAADAPLNTTPAAATAPAAPTINSITPGNGSLSVAFTAGSDGGSAITNYKYTTDGSTWTAAGVTTSPITISGLSNGTAYNVQIKAVNNIGDGTASTITAATPYTTPGAPTTTGVTSSNQALSVAFTAGTTGATSIPRMVAAEPLRRLARRRPAVR
ncbi:MAG: fibronectin type III domain-containing protein, partial [Proteobacteria bacterium]|nr:fibronectin type III domain-containing protein [Pseudomonadota bacterium]